MWKQSHATQQSRILINQFNILFSLVMICATLLQFFVNNYVKNFKKYYQLNKFFIQNLILQLCFLFLKETLPKINTVNLEKQQSYFRKNFNPKEYYSNQITQTVRCLIPKIFTQLHFKNVSPLKISKTRIPGKFPAHFNQTKLSFIFSRGKGNFSRKYNRFFSPRCLQVLFIPLQINNIYITILIY
eukprot:EC096221.1.p2 GENE.EC096221.1~~EC096221.1.p2  ORF type:complete len:186 (-),score=4.33 EC096221.1:37-594(-)